MAARPYPSKTNGVADDLANFEKGRIKALQEERLHIQKKTFTKWMNSFLLKVRMEVEDLFTDLADGKKLLKLLEIISGEKLGKPNNGKMRVHHVENVNKSLAFLHTKVRLESIGAEDIVDGNPRLILGLIWTIILRFQIQEIEIEVDEENAESTEKKSAKDALLLWCQRKTAGYPNVNIHDFTGSWRSGLGFNALIHAHRPDLINFSLLVPKNHLDNLNNAFDVAERGLGIPSLLDAEDIDCAKPDEKSVLTYVASYYHTFARMKNELKGGRRIANIVGQIMETENLKTNYELLTTNLLTWILQTTKKFNEMTLPNELESIKKELIVFKNYRTIEKPPKYKEKSEIEANYFNINIRLKELNQSQYVPPDGRLLHDIERAWEKLESSENKLEARLKQELIRQTNLEQIADRFWKKSDLREGYLKDMIQVLSDKRYGVNIGQVEATLKKHEAISADIMAREERCKQLKQMCEYLEKEKYHGGKKVREKCDKILQTWDELIALLNKHKTNLSRFNEINMLEKEIENLLEEVSSFSFDKTSTHLVECEDLLSKLALNEVQIGNLGEGVKRVIKSVHLDPKLEKSGAALKAKYDELAKNVKDYRSRLEEELSLYRLQADLQEELDWVEEKIVVVGGMSGGIKDLKGVVRRQQQLKSLAESLRARADHQAKLFDLAQESDLPTAILKERIATLKADVTATQAKLKNLERLFQFYQDCNEITDWISEKRPLVESTDYGADVATASALLKRHNDLVIEINTFKGDVEALEKAKDLKLEHSEDTPTWTQEQRLVPQEYYEEEPIERTEYQTVTEERAVAQVKALYPFTGQDIEMVKGEVMFLLNKTNADWWNVRKSNGQDGFVPANYVKEIEPKQVMAQVRKPVVIKEMKRVKKTKMVMQSFNKQVINPKKDKENLEAKINAVVGGYGEIVRLGEAREKNLQLSIKLFTYFFEADDFEKWLLEKHAQLTADNESDSIETAKKKFDKMFTDLSASGKRLEKIDSMAADLANHHKNVKPRQKQLHKLYDELQRLKAAKEKSLEGASIVELFHRNVSELEDWIIEKEEQIQEDFVFSDLKTVQALQRKHQNMERELQPIREKLERVQLLASDALNQYPKEKPSIEKALAKSAALYKSLMDKSAQKKQNLDLLVGKQIFQNAYKSLSTFHDSLMAQFATMVPIKDVSTAEEELKKHELLLDEIRNKKDEFTQIIDLGKKLSADPKILTQVEELTQMQVDLASKYQEKHDLLSQILDFQMFEKEADAIDRQVRPIDNVIEAKNLEEIELLIKQHNEYMNSLTAMEERVHTFINMAEKLEKVHYEKDKIRKRKEEVVANRTKIKEKSQARKNDLAKLHRFFLFLTEVRDMVEWIDEKEKHIASSDHRDLANLEKKLKKHQVFATELRANESKLNSLQKSGQKLINEDNNKGKVQNLLDELNSKWANLSELCNEKYIKLKQAEQQQNYNKDVDSLKSKLYELESELNSKDLGKDRRACKELLKKHELTENEIANCAKKIDQLEKLGLRLKNEGHFDGDRIVAMAEELKLALEKLKKPANKRRNALEELLRFYDFLFDLENELGYIQEKKSVLVSVNLPNNLHEATTKHKKIEKFQQEIINHTVVIEKVLQTGKDMIDNNHPEKNKIKKASEDLEANWSELLTQANDKRLRLELALKTHIFYNDALEIETWASEKANLLRSKDYGRDKDSSVKLLTKHKTIELEIDTYQGLVQEMGRLIAKNNPDYQQMVQKQEEIEELIQSLKQLANERRAKLIQTMNKHEFYIESEEFLNWIEDMIQVCLSEEYGVDFEHLERIRAKFNDTKAKVKNGEARLKAIESLVERIDSVGEKELGQVETVGARWATLLEALEARDVKLIAAGEIHRFNRDVAESLERINEKLNEIPEDSGKDYNSSETLMRRMEAFENDLVPLEAQLQVLIDDASRLSSLYPTNAPNIQSEQQLVVENWNNLQSKTEAKKQALQSALDYYKFLSLYRDLTHWSNNINKQLTKLESNKDANILMTDHDHMRIEIQTRNDKFNEVYALSVVLDKTPDIEEKLEHLRQLQNQLQVNWSKKKVYLDQLIDLQIFMRDSKMLESILKRQENILNHEEACSTVEEAERALNTLDQLEHVISKQENKFEMKEGKKLIEQNHFDKDNVHKIMVAIQGQRDRIIQLLDAKRKALMTKLNYLKFARDVEETLIYLDEKEKQLETLNKESVTLEEKVKKLKKHQAFEAELHSSNVSNVIERAKSMDKNLYQKLSEKWANLLRLSQEIGKGLEEAQEILDFENEAEKLEQFMRERELLVQLNDLGKDFEHCEELLKRLDQLDDESIKKINKYAPKLQDPKSQDRLQRLNARWNDLKSGLESYKKKLEASLQVHRFEKDVDELDLRIKEKIPQVSVEELGKDLDTVDGLIRKQDEVESHMRVIENRLKELENTEKQLPSVSMDKVRVTWAKLSELCFKRRTDLTDSHSYQKFLKKLREFESFVEGNVNKLKNASLPTNLTQAEELIQEHQGVKDELKAKLQQFVPVEKEMQRCIKEGHQYSDELNKCIHHVSELQDKLLKAMDTRDKVLDQGVKLQNFNKLASDTENVLIELDSTCKYYLGDDLPFLLKMIKVHSEVGGSLVKKSETKLSETTAYGEELINEKHYESAKIKEKIELLRSKYIELVKLYKSKAKSLTDSRDYRKFLENLHKVELYLREKLQLANDDNYSDMTNLQSKMQKHQAFEAEVAAFESRISALENEGRELIDGGSNHSAEIKTRLEDLDQLVRDLKADSNLKRDRLFEAYQALLFYNNLEDLEIFLSEPNFGEKGENLSQCKYLLKKWIQIRDNYKSKAEIRENVKKQNEQFFKANHFMREEISDRVKSVLEKFDSFGEQLTTKIEELTKDLASFEYQRDVDEMREFVAEKTQSVKTLELGNSVEQVKKLQKKLEGIESEVESVLIQIEKLSDTKLNEDLEVLKEEIRMKSELLAQSAKSQQFYTMVNDARFYIREKTTIFSSTDYGTDEESVNKLVKKFQTNYTNLQQFKGSFSQVIRLSEELNNNFDSERIQEEASNLKSSFTELEKLADTRKTRLSDAQKLYKFLRESNELSEWIEAQMHIAGSEDYGRDVEHVEILIQKFETFLQSVLVSGENRLEHLSEFGEELKEEKHPDADKIDEKILEVKSTWEEFKELATARSEALEGAKKVHVFDRGADECISWINEKLVALNDELDIKFTKSAQDLAIEEKALAEQVETVKKEAKELGLMFPDAEEHVNSKLEETIDAWNHFISKSRERQARILATSTVQEYFDNFDELISFLVDISGRVNSLSFTVETVDRAEWNLQRFLEIRTDFDVRVPDFEKFKKQGEKLITDKHFLTEEIFTKIKVLDDKVDKTKKELKHFETLLGQNLDLQKYYRDLNGFEAQLKSRESQLKIDPETETISQLEELSREFEDVEIFVDLIASKLGLVERTTLIEEEAKLAEKREREKREEEEKAKKNEEVRKREIERIRGERTERPTEPSKVDSHRSWFGDLLHRRGSDPVHVPSKKPPSLTVPADADSTLPRSSSFRSTQGAAQVKPKRTPSFTTRRRTQSFRKVPLPDNPNLPPTTVASYLERKQILLPSQKRSTNRSWKTYYTVLCGQLLCFFKDQEDFVETRPAASSPVNIYNCEVEEASDYVKRKFVFRVRLFDGSEFLFGCEDDKNLAEWVNTIKVVGKLEPREQLKESIELVKPSPPVPVAEVHDGHEGDKSSSEEDLRLTKPRSREPVYANVASRVFVEDRLNKTKPPIPPRSSSINKDMVDNGNNEAYYRMASHQPPKPQMRYPFGTFAPHPTAGTLPLNTTPPQVSPRGSASLPRQPQHDSSSESDTPKSSKNQQKRSSTGLMGLFKRKKATQL